VGVPQTVGVDIGSIMCTPYKAQVSIYGGTSSAAASAYPSA